MPAFRREARDCGLEGFLRRDERQGALLVSDAPRRMSTDKLSAASHGLADIGFTLDASGGLLYMGLKRARLRALLSELPDASLPAMPGDDLMPVWTLAARLCRAPCAEDEPLRPYYALFHALEAGKPGILRFCDDWPPRLAVMQRLGKPLPRGLSKILIQWIREEGDE